MPQARRLLAEPGRGDELLERCPLLVPALDCQVGPVPLLDETRLDGVRELGEVIDFVLVGLVAPVEHDLQLVLRRRVSAQNWGCSGLVRSLVLGDLALGPAALAKPSGDAAAAVGGVERLALSARLRSEFIENY